VSATDFSSKQVPLVLASASPRRRELLAQAGFTFEVIPANLPELRKPGEDPIRFVTRLAREKAEAIAARHAIAPDTIILGADTIVVVDEEVLGKPQDAADAARMLRLLSGRTHQVITGVCLAKGRERHSILRDPPVSGRATSTAVQSGALVSKILQCAAEVTFVRFNTLSDREIEEYVATGEPLDKAGAYAIQGRAGRWVPRIHGCYFNVVGLPIALVSSMIEAMQ
jgi:septum formation protein